MTRNAVILFAGGIDSSTILALTKSKGYTCYALTFDYGQRHCVEIQAAKRIAAKFEAYEHKIFNLRDLGKLGGSALTDRNINVPDHQADDEIHVTYVPARNTVFLSIALGWAEVLNAQDIFFGGCQADYASYPDCRENYMLAFQEMANLATRAGVEGHKIQIHTPLINLTKAETIQLGTKLGVDYSLTISCYQANADGHACGKCDACVIRKQGFQVAGIVDPTIYANTQG